MAELPAILVVVRVVEDIVVVAVDSVVDVLVLRHHLDVVDAHPYQQPRSTMVVPPGGP